MSIAELIMQGTNRASESTAWVGESLAKLGQNVGAALAQKEAQSQAQAVLPVLQATYKSAFDKIGQGNLSEGYGELMNAQLQFGASNNPFIQNMNQQMAAMSKQFADDYLRKSQIEAYKDRYTGTTTTENVFDPQSVVDTMNQGGEVAVDETVMPEGINPVVAAGMPGMRIPTESIQTQRGMGMTPRGMAAQAAPAPTGTPQTRDEIDAAAEAGLPTNAPTAPGVGLIKGVTPENALFPDLQKEPPPKNIIKEFIKFEDRFAALPFEKQKAEMDNNSILFPNKEMLANYKPSKGRGLIEISPAASVGIPGLAGAVEIPESYKKFIVGSVNINPATGSQSYNIRPEANNDPEAKAALGWLNDWQDASLKVSSNPDLASLLSQAGNDALAIDIAPVKVDPTKVSTISGAMAAKQDNYELSIKGKPESKIQVPKVAADQIAMLQSQTAAANIHNAKFIRLKTAPQAAPAAASKVTYKSATDVRSAVKSGALTKEEAMGILKSQFGYQ